MPYTTENNRAHAQYVIHKKDSKPEVGRKCIQIEVKTIVHNYW